MGQRQVDAAANNLLKLKEKVDTDVMQPPAFLMVLTGKGYALKRAVLKAEQSVVGGSLFGVKLSVKSHERQVDDDESLVSNAGRSVVWTLYLARAFSLVSCWPHRGQ